MFHFHHFSTEFFLYALSYLSCFVLLYLSWLSLLYLLIVLFITYYRFLLNSAMHYPFINFNTFIFYNQLIFFFRVYHCITIHTLISFLRPFFTISSIQLFSTHSTAFPFIMFLFLYFCQFFFLSISSADFPKFEKT